MVVKNEGVEGREGGGKSWFMQTRKRRGNRWKGQKKVNWGAGRIRRGEEEKVSVKVRGKVS